MMEITPLRLFQKQIGMIFGTVWCLVAGGMLTAAGVLSWFEYNFEKNGKWADASVTAKDQRQAKRTYYIVYYTYSDHAGKEHRNDSQVNEETWSRLKIGDTIKVRYIAYDPDQSRIAGESGEFLNIIFFIIAAVFGIPGGILFVRGLLRVRRNLEILRTGDRADAVVQRIVPAMVRIGRVRQMCICYEYRDYQGKLWAGKSDYLKPEEASRFQPGGKGGIRVLRRSPDQSYWVGD